MSYPQPSADSYAANGYEFFRLNTLLSSPGDIYESQQSGHAFAIGPESDIANVTINYFDDQVAPTFVQQTTISPGRAFLGRVDARNDATFIPAQRRARILISPADLFDPNFRPTGFDPDDDAIQFIQPRLDVIEYFAPLASLGPARVDKSYEFQNYPNASGTVYLVVPYYGRRYCYVQFTNRNSTDPATLGIIGVNYAITDDGSSNPYHQQTQIVAPVGINPGLSETVIITEGNQGRFDALVFSVIADPAPLRIVMSDVASGCPPGATGGGT